MSQLKTIALLGALSAILVGLGGSVAPGMLYLFVGLAAVVNLGAYFFSDRIVLRLHGARPLERAEAPGLHDMVAELAARAAISAPRLYLIPSPQANAFATGRHPERGVVAVTRGILETLTARELRGVIAHEIAHIRNRDVLVASVAATVAAAIGYIGNMLQWTAILGGGQQQDRGQQAGGLLAALVAPFAAVLLQLAISRAREYGADETAARLTGDPDALASALARLSAAVQRAPEPEMEPATASLFIVSPFAGRDTMLSWFSTHPPVGERIRRLRELQPGSFVA